MRCETRSLRRPCLSLATASVLLAGCASVSGFPERTEEVEGRLASLQQAYFLPSKDVLADYRGRTDPAARRTFRDEVVRARMMAIDLQFSVFREQVYKEGALSNLGIDLAGLVVGAAGAISTGAQASRIFSALSTGVTGADGSINETLYYERTMPALMALMEAERDRIRVEIERGLQQEDAVYALGQALVDLERYFQVGSIPGAIASVTEKAGETKAEAKADLNTVRDAAFVDPAAQKRAEDALNLVDELDADHAWVILNTPPSPLDPDTEALLTLRLGGRTVQDAEDDLTGANDENAKALLKMVLVNLNDRSEEGLGKWVTLLKTLTD